MTDYDALLAGGDSSAAPDPANPYDAALSHEADQQSTALRQSLYGALKLNPDQYAKAVGLEKQTGIPAPVVNRNLSTVQQQVSLDAAAQAAQGRPALQTALSHPDTAAMAHDDVDTLSKVSDFVADMFRPLASGTWAAAQGLNAAVAAPFGLAADATDSTLGKIPGGNPLRGAEQLFLGMAATAKQNAEAVRPNLAEAPWWQSGVYQGIESTAMMAPAMAATLASGGAAPALIYGGATQGGQSYQKGKEAGLSSADSAVYGGIDAAAEVGFEALPVGVFVKDVLGNAGLGSMIVHQLKTEIPGELGTQIVQNLNEWAAINPDKSVGDFLAEQPASLRDTFVATVVGIGANVGMAGAAQTINDRIQARVTAASEAERKASMFEQLKELAKASKLAQRSPDTFAQFVQDAAEQSGSPVTDVYVSATDLANTLAQSGIDLSTIQQSVPAIYAQYQEAAQTGGDIKIPVGEFAAKVATQEWAAPLIQHLKTDPNDMSFAEAQAFMSNQAQETQAEMEFVLAQHQADEAWRQSSQAVHDNVLEQLQGAGKFTDTYNRAYASLMQAFYSTTAHKLGVTPEELFQSNPVRIVGDQQQGDQLSQITPEQAKETNVPVDLPSDPLFAEAIGNTAGAKITPDGLALNLVRFQKPEQEGAQSVRTGVFYLPAGSKSARHYKHQGTAADNAYGGNEKFQGETLVRRPLFVKGATGGKAPEMAYDSLMGKGAAKKLNEEARHVGIDPLKNRDPELYREAVQRFLSEHGSDPGLAWEIIENSKRGNTMTYALQENVIAHAVRNAGYDAVIGYSKGKAGPFISEVFDVREQTYPANGMDSQIHDKFMQSAYHGSPHEFDRFSLDYIGTGEGAQAYGWGLYFAENKGVAQGYRERLSDPKGVGALIDGRQVAIDSFKKKLAAGGDPAVYQDQIDTLEKEIADLRKEVKQGPLYSVDIPDDAVARMLNLDETMRKQPTSVQSALSAAYDDLPESFRSDAEDSLNKEFSEFSGRDIYRIFEKYASENPLPGDTSLGGQADKETSQYFSRLGIPGLVFFDQWSRDGSGDGTRNIVLFDQPTIDRMNESVAKLYQDQRGSYSPNTATIAMLKAADATTFLHESGHFFLDTYMKLAAQPNTPQAITDDVGALLKWFGIKDLETWNGMTLDEQREHHEKFAEGFERYLFEGKAPNQEMRSMFRKFRDWLLNVYKSMKNMRVELNDEVRSIFDRMLATEEQIAVATQARGYAKQAFATQEESGMTDAEWQAYQKDTSGQTDDAVDALNARSLKDMQWLGNARSRVLKALQKANAELRKSVLDEVRAEIEAKPVYRAIKYLRQPADTKKKERWDEVNPSKDSLLVAIAKLGGMSHEAANEWGLDPESRPDSGNRQHPVIQREGKGGMSLDSLREALGELGYLKNELAVDPIHEFETAFRDELAGYKRYSTWVDDATLYGEAVDNASLDRDELNGVTFENMPKAKLDKQGLIDLFGDKEDALWKRLPEGRFGFVMKEGVNPEVIAQLLGYDSADALIQALVSAPPLRQTIENETDARMLARYGDLNSKQAMDRAVGEALANEVRTRFVAHEADAMQKAAGKPRILWAAAREYAQQIVSRRKIRDLKPSEFEAAERRADTAMQKARKAGKLVEAATEARNRVFNVYAAREAYKAQEAIDSAIKYLRKFDKEGTRKNLDPDYLDQIDSLLERFDFKPASLKAIDKRKALADWIKAQEDAGLDPQIDDRLRNEALRQHYRDMSVEEFRGLVDSIKNIEHLGRMKNRLLKAKAAKELQAVENGVVAAIEKNTKGVRRESWISERGILVAAKRMYEGFSAAHRKFASIVQRFDGHEDGGASWEALVWGMNDSGDMEVTEQGEAMKRFVDLMAPVRGKLGQKQYIAEINRSLTREERIGIALNMGNETNRERIVSGNHWQPHQLAAVLDTLSKEEWDFVQGVWDLLESYKPKMTAMMKRISGVEPEWVQPTMVSTKHGNYRGGYYPIAYDPTTSGRSAADIESQVQKQLTAANYVAASTRKGHLKERAASTGRQLRYDFGNVVANHLTQVIHDLSWREYLIDANKLLRNDGPIQTAVRERYGDAVVKQMQSALRDIAVGLPPAQGYEKPLNWMRTGAVTADLGLRLSTMMMQPIGLTQSMVRIGPKWVAKGMVHWLGDYAKLEKSISTIKEKSAFMRDRAKLLNRDVAEIRTKISDKNQIAQAIYFGGIAKMQMIADVPTWWGAYEKAMAADGGMTEEKAVALADQAVRDAQGAGGIQNQSAVERGGPAWKLFTTFYSFFNTTYNLASRSVERTDFKSPLAVAKLTQDMMLLFFIPALLGTLVKYAMKGAEDDDETLKKTIIADQIAYLFAPLVLGREFAGLSARSALGLPTMGYSGPAGLRFFEDMSTLAMQAGQGDLDAAFWKALNNIGGDVLHYPAGQVGQTVEGALALANGETDNPMALVAGAPKR